MLAEVFVKDLTKLTQWDVGCGLTDFVLMPHDEIGSQAAALLERFLIQRIRFEQFNQALPFLGICTR